MTKRRAFTTEAWDTARRSCVRVEFGHPRAECRALQVEATPAGRKVAIFMEPNDETDAAWQSVTLNLPDGYRVEVRGSTRSTCGAPMARSRGG